MSVIWHEISKIQNVNTGPTQKHAAALGERDTTFTPVMPVGNDAPEGGQLVVMQQHVGGQTSINIGQSGSSSRSRPETDPSLLLFQRFQDSSRVCFKRRVGSHVLCIVCAPLERRNAPACIVALDGLNNNLMAEK